MDSVDSTGIRLVLHGEQGCSVMSFVLTAKIATGLLRHNSRGFTELQLTKQPFSKTRVRKAVLWQ